MICSSRELGMGEDHDGIIVLPGDAGEPGDDAFDVLDMFDTVIEFEINPDRAYALSLRGIAREAAIGFDVAFHDRSEEHTSELQSLMRTSYAVFCLNKKINIALIK